jgi:hypothetical protein
VAAIPGGGAIYERYVTFRHDLPALCAAMRLDVDDLTFVDFSKAVTTWIRGQP